MKPEDQPSRGTSTAPGHPTQERARVRSSAERGHRGSTRDGRAERRSAQGAREPIVLDGAHFWGELTRAHAEIDTTRLSRDAAAFGRDQAELGRGVAERALLAAYREIASLQERVAFLEEQLQSTQSYFLDVIELNAAEMRVEREALLEEMGMLEAALVERVDSDEDSR